MTKKKIFIISQLCVLFMGVNFFSSYAACTPVDGITRATNETYYDCNGAIEILNLSVARHSSGKLYCFIQCNGQVYYKRQDVLGPNASYYDAYTWKSPSIQNGEYKWHPINSNQLYGGVFAGTNADGIHLFSVNPQGYLIFSRQSSTDAFVNWTVITNGSGVSFMNEQVTSNHLDGTVVVFVKKYDGYLYAFSKKSTPDWYCQRIGGTDMTAGEKFAVVMGTQNRLVAFMSVNERLYASRQNSSNNYNGALDGSWSKWVKIDYTETVNTDADLAVCNDNVNTSLARVFYTSPHVSDDPAGKAKMYSITQTTSGSYSSPAVIIDGAITDPYTPEPFMKYSAVKDGDNRIRIAYFEYAGSSNQTTVYLTHQLGTQWCAPYSPPAVQQHWAGWYPDYQRLTDWFGRLPKIIGVNYKTTTGTNRATFIKIRPCRSTEDGTTSIGSSVESAAPVWCPTDNPYNFDKFEVLQWRALPQ